MSLEKIPDFLLNFSGREMNGEEKHFYRFKSFRLDVEERQLFHNGVPVSLEPKVFDVLAMLVKRSGHLVEKDELLRTVWADSFVEEANIARVVHTLRKALGEERDGDKFIETVAKKGYRFVAKVTEASETPEPIQKNGKRDFLRVVSEPPVLAGGSDMPQTVAPPAAEAKQKTRIVLFGVGFLSAVFLILFLSFSFQSGSSGNPNHVKSIAVLPLIPINSANRDEIYEIGIAESVIHQLSAAKGFVVRPLSATRKYADIEQDAIAAGKEQQADYVLASNYQLAGGKIRVTSQLFNVTNERVEETYKIEKEANDVFAMQDAIAGEIGNNLLTRFAITLRSPKALRGTTDEEAYRLYLHGRNVTERQNRADSRKAIEYFEQAIRLDPNYSRAYAGMARARITLANFGGDLPRVENEKAREAINKAFELDNNLPEAYAVRGNLKIIYEWDFAGAEKDLLRAIELEPNNDLAHWLYAMSLAHRGRFDEAISQMDKTLTINPGSLIFQRERGRFLYYARRYDEAIVQLKRIVELDENFATPYRWIWFAYQMKRDEAQAYEWFMKTQKHRNPDRLDVYQKTYETAGWQAVRRKHLELEKLNENKPGSNFYDLAIHCAFLGEKEQAFEYLNKAVEKREWQASTLNFEPTFDSLRDDPRFAELINRAGLK